MRLMLIAVAACCTLYAQQVSAQPIKKDHRDRKVAPMPPPAPQVRAVMPKAGAPGATVTLRGIGLPPNATVMIGKRKVQAAAPGGRGAVLQFAVPERMRPGVHKVSVELNGAMVDVGTFEVTADATTGAPVPPPVADPPMPPPPPAPIAVGEPRPDRARVPSKRPDRKRWASYQFPVVNRYGPAKGDAGTQVTIHGANFTPALEVFLGDAKITGATIKPNVITFKVPRGASDGVITVRGAGNRRALAVGQFEVIKFDFRAAQKQRQEERRKAAEEAWKQRQKELAKDRAARMRALQEREAALAASREQRRLERLAEIRAQFKAAFLADEMTQAEMALHAERLARLQRMVRLAEANADGKLVVRIEIAIAKENDRHGSRMATLEAAFQVQ